MKWNAFEASFFQLLKPTTKCDKLQYKCKDANVRTSGLSYLVLTTQDKCTEFSDLYRRFLWS